MMKATRFHWSAAIALIVLIGLIGCRAKPDKAIGYYTGKVAIPNMEQNNPERGIAKEYKKNKDFSVTLDLREDHTFTMHLLNDIDGSWKSDGKQITLSPKKYRSLETEKVAELASSEKNFNSKDLQQAMVLKRNEDESLTLMNDVTNEPWITLNKQKKT